MSGSGKVRPDAGATLLDLYDTALPEVYGYLLSRCGRAVMITFNRTGWPWVGR